MPSYRVTWEIDVEDAEDPREAAERAWAHMRWPTSTANYFTVKDVDTGESVDVDLSEEA